MSDPARMDDTQFLHHVLSDGQWHRQMDILAESGRVRGCGMTVHSRAATLRARGFVVVNRQHIENGRRISEYRLLSGTAREGHPDRLPVAETCGDTAQGGSLGPSQPLAVCNEAGHDVGPVEPLPPEVPQSQPARQPTLWEAA